MNGYTGLSEEDMLQRFIFVVDGMLVYDNHTSEIMKLTEFKAATASCTTLGPKGAVIKVSGLWMVSPMRLTADVQRWRPGALRMFTEEGVNCLNTFRFPDHKKKGKGWDFFVAHVRHLYGDDADLFLDWLAHIVQYPGVRPKIVPLHIAYKHGAGRGWIVEVMTGVLGWWNVTSHKMKDIASGQWGDYLHEKLLVAVHEVRDKGKIYEVDDQVRDLMTEPRLRVNLKGGRNLDIEIFARFFWMSNHADAVALTEADRRTWAKDLGLAVKDEAYFVKAYGMLGAGLFAGVFAGLMARDISKFNPGMRAPMNDAKRRMIGAVESAADETIQDMIASGCNVVTAGLVRDWPGESELPEGHVRAALRTFAVKARGGERIKWRKAKVAVWILNNDMKMVSETISTDRLRDELDASAVAMATDGVAAAPPGDTVVPFKEPQ